MTQPRMLDGKREPCALRRFHRPKPVRTQSHHRFPEYLQKRLWGQVLLDERLPLCGTDHDSLHTWVAVLLGEQARPLLSPGTAVEREAERVVAWYRAEQAKGAGTAYGKGEFGRGTFGGHGLPAEEWDGKE